jgi:recombination protein RecA
MAKKKAAASAEIDDDFFEELAVETAGDVLDQIDSVRYFVDTGSLALNYICSGRFITGGIPGGKLTEIYGPNSSSKSLLGANILFGCQRMKGIPVLEDCENSANKEFIKQASHCDLKKIVRHTPQSLEQVFAKMYKVIEFIRSKKGTDAPIVIVYDSIGVSPSERELREVQLPENYTKEQFKKIVGGNEQPGERAKICSREFRKLNTVMEKHNATVVILNQTRAKIGGFAPMGMQAMTTAGGGNALPFYASCRIETKTQLKIERKLTAKKKKILGINVRLKNVKNKTHRPFIESDNVQLLFDRGINPLSGLLSCLLDADRLEMKGSGNFVVKEPWAGGLDIKFKASIDRNDFPMDVLLKCPTLIDATSEEQVREYLEPFRAAIDFDPTKEADVVTEDVLGEDEDSDIDAELEGEDMEG